MPEQGAQFTCPQCGKPQFTAEFGFEKHFHSTNEVKDPCVFCGESTAPGGMNHVDTSDIESVRNLINNIPLMNPKFLNRVPADNYDEETGKYKDGYACADCMSRDCDGCGKKIPLDEDVQDEYGNRFHHSCLAPSERYGWGQDCDCSDCKKWKK